MGYAWLEEAGLIAGTPEWEEREHRAFADGEEGYKAWLDSDGLIHRGNA